MPDLQVVVHHADHGSHIEPILNSISDITGYRATLVFEVIDLDPFLEPQRAQYNAADLISLYEARLTSAKSVLITDVDLFIPIFTHVFGLAKLGGQLAAVSLHRLMPEYYGLPPDPQWLQARLKKEIIHEFGHLVNLRHCNQYYCVMASSNTADDLDIKSDRFCPDCRYLIPR